MPWGTLVALFCLALPAIHPFLLGKMPLTADGLLHLYRLISLDHAIQYGDLWPRYVPGMVFGYGAPFFNYYSPLSLYPLEVFHLLGASFLSAWLIGSVFYTILAAGGAYLLGKAWLGPIGGFAAAAAYVYAPYTLFDSVWRGTTAELAALALLPWVFWGFWRLVHTGGRRDFLIAVICLTLFVPLHNVITLHGAGLLGIYCIFLWWASDQKRRVFTRVILALGAALGLTAFFWLPALAETEYVKINEITANLPDIDVTRNLGTLWNIFAPPLTADPTQLQPPVPISLSWPQLILGAIALGLIIKAPVTRKVKAWLWLTIPLMAVLIFMNTPPSAAIWEIIPLIRYSQFPWRLIGLASFLLALLAGAGVVLIERYLRSKHWKIVWVGGGTAVMIIYAIPWLYTIYLPTPPAAAIVDAQNFERQTGWIATSSFGEYLPRWNETLPDPNRLEARYAQAEVIPRLEAPPGAVIQQASWGTTSADLMLAVEKTTTLTFDWFYFPGWWAVLDEQPLPVTPSKPEGLLNLTIPEGEHHLEIGLAPTPLQAAAAAVSAVTLLVSAGVLFWLHPKSEAQSQAPDHRIVTAVAIIGVFIFAGKALVIDHAQTPLKRERFANGVAAGVQNPIQANFDGQITLLGYDLAQSQIASGSSASINLYWQADVEKIETDYSSILRLKDNEGSVVAQTGSFYPGGLATTNWMPGYYIQERLPLNIPAGTPPGIYSLEVSLFAQTTQQSLNVINVQGNPEDVKVMLGNLTVLRPDAPPDITNINIPTHVNTRLNDSLAFMGFQPLPDRADVGQELDIEWYWKAEAKPDQDYSVQILWMTPNGNTVASSKALPLVNGYPTNEWRSGDIWRGLHRFYVPGRLETGDYITAVQLVDARGGVQGTAPLGSLAIKAPPRTLAMPDIKNPVDIEWANGIRLLGYDLNQDETLNLVFYWQPAVDLTASLRVFVHLVDEQGHIVTQIDRIPANWTRPTTGWSPGEIITDAYVMTIGSNIPSGPYTLRIGWYDPRKSRRISLSEGDFWTLPEPIHVP